MCFDQSDFTKQLLLAFSHMLSNIKNKYNLYKYNAHTDYIESLLPFYSV